MSIINGNSIAQEKPSIFDFRGAQLNGEHWCPCQIDTINAPVELIPNANDPSDHFARIVAHQGSLGGNVCKADIECKPPFKKFSFPKYDTKEKSLFNSLSSEGLHQDEVLLRSIFAEEFVPGEAFKKSIRKKTNQNPFCTPERLKQAVKKNEEIHRARKGECVQRQELRFQKELRHPSQEPHIYSIRFRMPEKDYYQKDSLRWVISQWKHDVDETYYGYGFSPSPFLAQRFDDAVHHVTIQDEKCRCLIASAPHPTDTYLWQDGTPHYCSRDGVSYCKPEFTVEYGKNPILSSPIDNWVTMKFQVQASRENAEIVIEENGRLIARVYGKIGYRPSTRKKPLIKFKFGQYRDFQETEDHIDVDFVKVSKGK